MVVSEGPARWAKVVKSSGEHRNLGVECPKQPSTLQHRGESDVTKIIHKKCMKSPNANDRIIESSGQI